MGCLEDASKIVLLTLPLLFGIKVAPTQVGSSYFFYQQLDYPRDCKEALDRCSSENTDGIYVIKPDGYPHPFEIYCVNHISSGGWTVIQRRLDGSLKFSRLWEHYKHGFGFLNNDFWIGNDKLSHLTNQAVYELRIDMMLSNGSSFYVGYKSFRISDEEDQYALVTAGKFCGNSSCVISTCTPGMNHAGCTCQRACNDSVALDICHEDCKEICTHNGCGGTYNRPLLLNGHSVINFNCTENCTCIDFQISCNPDYSCSPYATCLEKDGVRKCYCNDGYKGDGETCIRNGFTDCYDAYQAGQTTDGIYTITPTGQSTSIFEVFCNMTFAGGGWTVVQRRVDGITSFFRDWLDYKQGFGSLDLGSDFWLGNEQLYYLTNQKDYKLRVDMVTFNDIPTYAEYTPFKIGNETAKYRLLYGTVTLKDVYNGLYTINNTQFSTRDQDNDGCSNHSFAEGHKGGWWYGDNWCSDCTYNHCRHFRYGHMGCNSLGAGSNLNGDYNGGNGENIFWASKYLHDCNLKFVEMKLRPSPI